MLFTPLLDIQTVCWHEREQNKTHTKKSWIGYLQKKGPPNASRHRQYNSQHLIISDTQRNIFVSALFRQNPDSGGKKTKRAEHSEPCRVVFKALQLSRKTWIFALTDNAHGETLTTERNLEKKRSRVERKPDLCSTKRSFCLPPVDTWLCQNSRGCFIFKERKRDCPHTFAADREQILQTWLDVCSCLEWLGLVFDFAQCLISPSQPPGLLSPFASSPPKGWITNW